MNGKEFIEYIKTIDDDQAAAIIDNMNDQANKMADKIERFEKMFKWMRESQKMQIDVDF